MIGRCYDHNPQHYRFIRSTQEFQPIEEYRPRPSVSWPVRLLVIAAFLALCLVW